MRHGTTLAQYNNTQGCLPKLYVVATLGVHKREGASFGEEFFKKIISGKEEIPCFLDLASAAQYLQKIEDSNFLTGGIVELSNVDKKSVFIKDNTMYLKVDASTTNSITGLHHVPVDAQNYQKMEYCQRYSFQTNNKLG